MSYLDALAERFPGDPDALLWLGSARISHAWSIRCGSLRQVGRRGGVPGLVRRVETAAEPLFTAANLVPSDQVPWERLMWFRIGMGLDRPGLDQF